MKTLLLRRLAVLLPTLLLVSMMVFGLQKLLPGDPALALAGEERNPEVVEYLRHKYRFNDPIPVQYAVWLKALVHGDFGTSVRTRLPIGTMLAEKLPVTIELAILSMLVALLVGLPIGIFAAPYFASSRLIVPEVAGEDEQAVASVNAVLSGANQITQLAGPVLAGVIIGFAGASTDTLQRAFGGQ